MNSSLDILTVDTVPSDFSWDQGVDKRVPAKVSSTVGGLPLYIGYAPITTVRLSSVTDHFEFDPLNSIKGKNLRIVDFGDYYNSETNLCKALGTDGECFKHTYIMPGTYSVTIYTTDYTIITELTDVLDSSHTYFQSGVDIRENNLAWQWDNMLRKPKLPFNRSVTWDELNFQNYPDVTWNRIAGTSLTEIDKSGNIVDNTTQALIADDITTSRTGNFFIQVKEITPTAYLSATMPLTPKEYISPLTVRLSPRYTQTGSFPIEKIVWDLGDDTPNITQRRWHNSEELPFVFTGALSEDKADPRNYDVIYTYTKTPETDYSFYPSITAYACSTGTYDTCKITIGPLLPEDITTENKDLKVLQSDLTDTGTVLVGQIGKDVGVWKT